MTSAFRTTSTGAQRVTSTGAQRVTDDGVMLTASTSLSLSVGEAQGALLAAMEGSSSVSLSGAAALSATALLVGALSMPLTAQAGTLLGVAPVEGANELTLSTQGSLRGEATLAGTLPLTFATAADLSSQDTVTAGTSFGLSTAGALVGIAERSAQTSLILSTQGTLVAPVGISGSLPLTLAVTAAAEGKTAFAGTTALTYSMQPAVAEGWALLAGSTSMPFFTTAAAEGAGKLAASPISLRLTTTGVLGRIVPITASPTSISFNLQATLFKHERVSIAGSTSIRWLVGAGPEPGMSGGQMMNNAGAKFRDLWVDMYVKRQKVLDAINRENLAGITANASATSALTTRVEQTEDELTAQAGSITQLQATLVDGTNFSPNLVWDFNNSLSGFSVQGITHTLTPTYVRLTATNDDPTLSVNAGLDFDGAQNDRLRIRVRRVAGQTWDGKVYYATTGHGFSELYYKWITTEQRARIDGGGWHVIELKMDQLDAGGTDWVDNIITGLRFDLGTSATDVFDVDWISVGSEGGKGFLSATAVQSLDVRVTQTESELTSTATSLTSLESRVLNNENDIAAQANATSELSTRVTQTETTLSAQAQDITALQVDVDGTVSAVQSLEVRASSIEGAGAGMGVNLLSDTAFLTGTTTQAPASWAVWFTQAGPAPSVFVVDSNVNPNLPFDTRALVSSSDGADAGALVLMRATRHVRVEGGKKYILSLTYNGQPPGMYWAFYDANGNYISEAGGPAGSGYVTPGRDNGQRVHAAVTVPSNARTIRFGYFWYKAATNSVCRVWRPMLEQVPEYQTQPSPWNQGGGEYYAAYTLRLDVNGHVSGFGSYNDGNSSEFAVVADKFRVVNPSGGAGLTWENGTLWSRGASQSVMLGQSFGASGDLMFWAGPNPASVAAASKSNAKIWFDNSGGAYFGGAIAAGALTNSIQTTLIGLPREVTLGPFGTNGGVKTVLTSYIGDYSLQIAGDQVSTYNGKTATVRVHRYRTVAGSGEVYLGYFDVSVTSSATYDSETGLTYVNCYLSGSHTFGDNTGGTSNFSYRAYAEWNSGTVNWGQAAQKLSIISIED